MTNLTLIDETMNIEAGATLYHQCPVRGMRPVKVARITKTLIILDEGSRFNRKGYRTGDEWKRNVLYIEVKESAEETNEVKAAAPARTIEERRVFVESRKEARELAKQQQSDAEIMHRLGKLSDMVARRDSSDNPSFYQKRIDEQLVWFQRHDISITMDNGDYILVNDDEEQEQTMNTPAPEANKATTVKPMQSDAQLSYSVMRNHEIMVVNAYPQHLDKERIAKVRAQVAAKEDALLTWAGLPLASDHEERQRLIKTAMSLPSNFNAEGQKMTATQHYETFVKEQKSIKDAKEQLKDLRAAGESAAMSARKNATGTTAQKLDAIRTAWVPFHQAIAKIEHAIAQHQSKSDAAWEAYERAQ